LRARWEEICVDGEICDGEGEMELGLPQGKESIGVTRDGESAECGDAIGKTVS